MRKVNKDGTYDVYFPEDSEPLQGVAESDIKAPINTGKTAHGVTDRLGGMGSGPLRNFVPPLSNMGEMFLYTKK